GDGRWTDGAITNGIEQTCDRGDLRIRGGRGARACSLVRLESAGTGRSAWRVLPPLGHPADRWRYRALAEIDRAKSRPRFDTDRASSRSDRSAGHWTCSSGRAERESSRVRGKAGARAG